VDALWVLKDQVLLQDETFVTLGWRPGIAALGVPVVVGAAELVTPAAHFGTLALLPDLEPLGVQAANLLFEIADSDWSTEDHPIEPPVSTITVLNARQARAQFGLVPGSLSRVDTVLE
jgi:hypothetical protein